MLNYLIRRVLLGCITLLIITFLIYGLIRNMPGSPLTAAITEMDPSKKINPEDFKRMAKTYGLDTEWYVGYWVWLGNAARLDFGSSFTHKKPVTEVIGQRIGPTLILSITSIS